MSRPPSQPSGPRTAAENRGPGSQFLADGQGDQNVASSGGSLYSDHRQWNNIFHIADIERGMPSMRRAFANIDSQGKENNNVTFITTWLARQPHCGLVDSRSRHVELISQTTPNTGGWILETKHVKAWQKKEMESRYLSLQGNLGSGKSILMSGIIQSTEQKVSERTDMACVYFYFQEGDADQISVTSMWASLLQQLLQQCAPNAIAKELQDVFDSSLQGTNSIQPFEFFRLFKAQAARFKVVYVIIDSLDSCKDYDNGKVQQSLSETFHRLPSSIRVLFSSRQDLLARHLSFKNIVRIKPTKSDVETYAKARIKNNEHLHRLLSRDEDKNLVIETITKQTISSEMFLLARLHLDRLGSNIVLPDLRRDLEQLSVDLAHVFESSLVRISKDCASRSNGLAQHVLASIIYSKEDITIDQVRESVALSKNHGTSYQEWRPDPDSVLLVCAGLVVLDSNKMTLRLVHESARKSIFDYGIVPRKPGPEMAKICLTCLLWGKNESPLLSYSATQWTSHLNGIDLKGEKELRDLIKAFLINYSKLTRAFNHLGVLQEGVEKNLKGMTGLHAVAYLDLPVWIGPLVKYGINIDARCADGQTPLHWAVAHGRRRVARHLLRFDADPNAKDSSKDTPLHKFLSSPASEGLDIAETLIQAGAKVCIANLKGVTPLSSAIRYGPTSAAKLFILSRKDINEEIEPGWTSLREVFDHGSGRIQQLGSLTSNKGSLKCVRHAVKDHLNYLVDTHLEHRVKLNHPTSSGWLALSHAAKSGSVTILKKLLEHKWDPADCNLRDPMLGKSPLHWALEYSHTEAARLLIKSGAEVDEKNDDGWKPLIEATKARRSDMVHFLITKGADVNATDNEGVSSLMHAVEVGDKDITWLLLVNGANVNLQARNRAHSIGIAIANRDLSLAWLLCEHGANLKAVDGRGRTLLHQAAVDGHQGNVMFLLSKGLSIRARDKEGLTPLHHAAISGSHNVVTTLLVHALSSSKLLMLHRLLAPGDFINCQSYKAVVNAISKQIPTEADTDFDAKVTSSLTAGLLSIARDTDDIDITDNMGFTAVHHAVSNDKISCLHALFEGEPDLDILDHRGYTPLMLAVYLDKAEAARVLLREGADPYKRNNQQVSAVDLEARKKEEKRPSSTQPYIAQALRDQGR